MTRSVTGRTRSDRVGHRHFRFRRGTGRPLSVPARCAGITGARRPQGHRGHSDAPPMSSRIAAGCSLALCLATLVVLIAFTARDLVYVLASLVVGALGISALWIAATNRRFDGGLRPIAVVLVVGALASLVAAGRGLVAVATVLVGVLGRLESRDRRRCVGRSVRPSRERWHQVPATRQGVILMNPRSGDGKVGPAASGRRGASPRHRAGAAQSRRRPSGARRGGRRPGSRRVGHGRRRRLAGSGGGGCRQARTAVRVHPRRHAESFRSRSRRSTETIR